MLYAAYGSNLHPLRLSARLASARLLGTGQLANWSLRFHKKGKDESGKCSIVAGDEGVFLAVFDISAEDKLALDRIEGLGRGYAETSLHVPPFGECASYIAEKSSIDESLRPYDWYKDLVLAGGRAHGFPDSYLARIASVQAIRDPDRERAASNAMLLERIGAAP